MRSTLGRHLDVALLLAQAGPLSIADISDRTGIPLSTVHRLIPQAVELGSAELEQDRHHRAGATYRAGPWTAALARTVATARPPSPQRVETAVRVLATALPRAPRTVLVPLAGELVDELDREPAR